MTTQTVSTPAAKPRQFTLQDVMIWVGGLGLLWGLPSLFPAITIGAILAAFVYDGFVLSKISGWRVFRELAIVVVLASCLLQHLAPRSGGRRRLVLDGVGLHMILPHVAQQGSL